MCVKEWWVIWHPQNSICYKTGIHKAFQMGNARGLLTFMYWNSHEPAVSKPLAVVWPEYSYLNIIILAVLSHRHARIVQRGRWDRHNNCWTGWESIDLALSTTLLCRLLCKHWADSSKVSDLYRYWEYHDTCAWLNTVVQDDVILGLMGEHGLH